MVIKDNQIIIKKQLLILWIMTQIIITNNNNSKIHRIDKNVNCKIMIWTKFKINLNLLVLKSSFSSNCA